MAAGTMPRRLFPWRLRCTREEQFARTAGSVPSRRLPSSQRNASAGRPPRSPGMVPLRRLKERSRSWRREAVTERLAGIGPEKALEERSMYRMSGGSAVGTGPVKRFPARLRTWRLERLERKAWGRGPERVEGAESAEGGEGRGNRAGQLVGAEAESLEEVEVGKAWGDRAGEAEAGESQLDDAGNVRVAGDAAPGAWGGGGGSIPPREGSERIAEGAAECDEGVDLGQDLGGTVQMGRWRRGRLRRRRGCRDEKGKQQ
ncbi:hypothetical protein C4D60_Mb08t11420 [Musa balbisiana]|uniref:Uncharacterized protein n=1 Tax=Musa balbisiana TaxID=52838 RepID=A0A4S8K303_MUSBA|nr:hypothetical protein C4D60_Mb08t11420 [Musa balbisiana]